MVTAPDSEVAVPSPECVRNTLIREEKDWESHKKTFPSVFKAEVPEYPFVVLSLPLSANVWDYHFFTQAEARHLLSDHDYPATIVFKDRAISGVRFEELPINADDRGHLVELFRRDELQSLGRRGGPRIEYPPMAYLSLTKAGQIRGPHIHFSQTDIFIFCRSSFEVFLWDMREGSFTFRCRHKETTPEQAYTRLIVPPGVVHAYRAIEDGLVVNCPDKLFRGWEKKQPVDEMRYEDQTDSPFRLW